MSTVESMRFICGGCGYRARIPSSYTGKVILCPGCQQAQIAAADGGDATGDTVRVSKVATAPGTGRFSVPDADGRLRFTCSGCGYGAKLAATYAGKAISCPQCKSAQVIPPLQGPEGGAGKAQPSPALEAATAPTADDGLTFDDEPAKPAAATPSTPAAPRKPAAAAVSDDDGLTFGDEPAARATPSGDNDATKPTAVASAKASASASAAKAPVKPSTKPGSGGVVRRGSRSPQPPPEPEVDEDEQDDEPAKPSKPLPPWAQKLKEPRMMALIGGGVAVLILQIVLISGWVGASNQAEENRTRAEASETRATTLEKQKADVEFTLSKTNEEVKRLKQTESEAKAALAAAETRVTDLGEQLKKAEADKADEYARRKKAETDHDDMFKKLKDAEKKRDEQYRITTEFRSKYEEEAKLRKGLQTRLDEAKAASK